jgi:hypothetical protein
MDTNDIVYAVAKRARELANKPVLELRIAVAEAATSASGAVKETRGQSRGELIEAILCEEFIKEFPDTIERDV